MKWAIYGGELLIMRAFRSFLGWRSTSWWRNRNTWRRKKDPANVTRWKHEFGFHNRGVQWETPNVEVGGRREGLDTACGTRTALQGGRDDQPPEDGEAADGEENTKEGGDSRGPQRTRN